MTNRFKGLDLIDTEVSEAWSAWRTTEVCNIVQDAVIKTILKKKKCKKAKWLSEEALQIGNRRREAKGKGEKEKRKDIPIWMQSSREEQGEIRKWSMQRNTGKQ